MRLHPAPVLAVAAEEVYADLRFPARSVPDAAPYVAVNMVTTLDGKVSVGGKASPIGSVVDRLIMRNIRCAVDAVLVGAGTVRAEEMNLTVPAELSERRRAAGLSGQPLGVILAGTGELPLERKVFRTEGQRVFVVAGKATPESTLREASTLGIGILRAKRRVPDPPEILGLLRERLDVSTVLLEGGPTVNGSFLSAGRVDELFLTLTPKISGSRQDALTLVTPGQAEPSTTRFDLESVHSSTAEGELYLRYRHPRHLRSGFR